MTKSKMSQPKHSRNYPVQEEEVKDLIEESIRSVQQNYITSAQKYHKELLKKLDEGLKEFLKLKEIEHKYLINLTINEHGGMCQIYNSLLTSNPKNMISINYHKAENVPFEIYMNISIFPKPNLNKIL